MDEYKEAMTIAYFLAMVEIGLSAEARRELRDGYRGRYAILDKWLDEHPVQDDATKTKPSSGPFETLANMSTEIQRQEAEARNVIAEFLEIL